MEVGAKFATIKFYTFVGAEKIGKSKKIWAYLSPEAICVEKVAISIRPSLIQRCDSGEEWSIVDDSGEEWSQLAMCRSINLAAPSTDEILSSSHRAQSMR